MAEKQETQNTYVIPPNFIESGTFFGGMFKVRNAIEAGVLALAVGWPVFNLGLSLTTRIIILCMTSLPLALFGLIGISGESLSSFIIIFFKYLKNRRVVGSVSDEKGRASSAVVKKNKKTSIRYSHLRAVTYPASRSAARG
jgi:hypothetical protein